MLSDDPPNRAVGRRSKVSLRSAVAACCTAGLVLAAACSNGDSGQHRLHELAAEQVFTVAPPGLTEPPVPVQTPAHKRPSGFGSGGWEGPSVISTFTTAADPASVLRSYDEKATQSGWRGTGAGAYQVTDRWTKTYPDGTPASLTLTVVPRGGTASYQLAASAPASP
jgi:hypothetical protein